MSPTDWPSITRDKDAARVRNANLPLSEKLAQLDRLRERTREIKGGEERTLASTPLRRRQY